MNAFNTFLKNLWKIWMEFEKWFLCMFDNIEICLTFSTVVCLLFALRLREIIKYKGSIKFIRNYISIGRSSFILSLIYLLFTYINYGYVLTNKFKTVLDDYIDIDGPMVVIQAGACHVDMAVNIELKSLLILFVTSFLFIFFLILSLAYDKDGLKDFEFPILASLMAIGLIYMIKSTNFISFFLGMELVALSLVCLASIKNSKDEVAKTESALKFYIMSAISTGLGLFGMSLIYKSTGCIDFDQLSELIKNSNDLMLYVGIIFFIISLFFKIGIYPFNIWIPDLYKASSKSFLLLYSTLPKFIYVFVLIRFMQIFRVIDSEFFQYLIVITMIITALSAFASIFFAIETKNFMEMFFWASSTGISVIVFMLAIARFEGIIGGILVMSTMYLLNIFGLFVIVLNYFFCSSKIYSRYNEEISELSGFYKHYKSPAILLCIYFFSIIGLPPLSLFFGKMYLIFSVSENICNIEGYDYFDSIFMSIEYLIYRYGYETFGFLIIAMIINAISSFYYLRIIKVVLFDKPYPITSKPNPVLSVLSAFLLLLNLTICLNPKLFLFLVGCFSF